MHHNDNIKAPVNCKVSEKNCIIHMKILPQNILFLTIFTTNILAKTKEKKNKLLAATAVI
jgi:hypothetical protein